MGKGTVDLQEIREYLSRVGFYDTYLSALCPFHEDGSPSFFVNEEYYYCMSCRAYGDTSGLLNRLSGDVHVYEASVSVKNPFPSWIRKYGTLTNTLVTAYKVSQNFPVQMSYMLERGLSEETLKRNRIGWLDGWITFPSQSQGGGILGATARLIDGAGRYMNPTGQSPSTLYVPNWKRVENASQVYLVFGMVDALTLDELELPVITTMAGIGIKPSSFDGIRKRLYVIPDKGEEEKVATLVSKMGWRGKLKTINWPLGCKDINDVWKKDKQLLKELVEEPLKDKNTLLMEMGYA